MSDEFVRVYSNGEVAYRLGNHISKRWDPYDYSSNEIWRFCVIFYECLPFNKIDHRFNHGILYHEILMERVDDDFKRRGTAIYRTTHISKEGKET